jgi:hypothetical protein
MWETLWCGSIPVVLKSNVVSHFREDLPMLEFECYTELTEDFLEQEYERISNTNYPRRFLNKQYWIDRWLKDIQ